jgi:signal transduction histidine kinase
VRHARATEVRVDLRTDRGMVRMSVHDNGVGLPPHRLRGTGTFGLIGIEERVRILGGTVTLRSEPGVGTTVEVTIPVQQEEPVAVKPAQLPGAAALHPDTVN